jgi:hypothetical protein
LFGLLALCPLFGLLRSRLLLNWHHTHYPALALLLLLVSHLHSLHLPSGRKK